MKEIFTLFLISILISSVFSFFWISHHSKSKEYNKIEEIVSSITDTVKPTFCALTVQNNHKTFSVDGKDYTISLGSDGHDYYGTCIGGETKYFHYPDCQKCNLKDSLILDYLKHISNEKLFK